MAGSRTSAALQRGPENAGEIASTSDSVAAFGADGVGTADSADAPSVARPTIESLPRDVWPAICRRLKLRDVVSLGGINRRFRAELAMLVAGLPRGDLSNELASSVCAEDSSKVRFLLRFDAVRRAVNDLDVWGRSPLWWAARGGDVRIVRQLLAVPGIDVDRCNPLWIATTVRATCVVRALLGRHADVNAREDPQTNAVLEGTSQIGGWMVRTLFGSVAIPCGTLVRRHFPGGPGDPHDEVAPGLSRADALACVRGHPCHAPLRIAAQRGYLPIVRWLLRDPRIRPNLDAPIVGAALNGHRAIVDILLERPDVDVNQRDSDGLDAMRAAILRGRDRVLERLLASGRVAPDFEFAFAAMSNRSALRVIAVMDAWLRSRARAQADSRADAQAEVQQVARANAQANAAAEPPFDAHM